MTMQYQLGELSVRLEQLAAVATPASAAQVVRLRHAAESASPGRLSAVAERAMVLADRMCRESLTRGDPAAFTRQAAVSADLRQFAVRADLISDE